MNKVKAFTVLELIVVLLLSSIVITIAYTTFTILSRQYIYFKESQYKIQEVFLLDRLLGKDFAQSRRIYRSERGINCMHKKKNVFYYFDSEYIIREDASIIDTFHISTEHKHFLFSSTEVEEAGRVVDELQFSSTSSGKPQLFWYTKPYGAELYLEEQKF